MILHIPHASTNTASLDIDPVAVLKTTDHFTDDLFNDGDISYHQMLTNRVIEQFEAFGYSVGVNEPYAN